MPPKLSQLLDPARVCLQVRSTRRTTAINEVARLLESHPDVANFPLFYTELLARERLDTTCIGNEIALPHARTEHVRSVVIAAGRSADGILFENSGQNVRLLFVIGTPKSRPADYLAVVGSLLRILKEASIRDALMKAGTPEDFAGVIARAEGLVEHNTQRNAPHAR